MDQANRDFIIKITCAIKYVLQYFRTIIIIMLICGIGFDVFKTTTYTPTYGASVDAVFSSGETNTYSALESTLTYMKNMNYIFNNQQVQSYICEQLKIPTTSIHSTIYSKNETNMATIVVTADTKREAFYAVNYILEWYRLNKEEYKFNYTINLDDSNAINVYQANNNSHPKNFIIGSIGSGILICALFAFKNYFSNTVKTASDIQTKIASRLYSKLPKEKKKRGKKSGIIITSLRTSFTYREAIKKLRSRIEESSKKHGYKSIMVTGSLENEGKSSVAVNLAIALAQSDNKVLLMDCDFRKPSVNLLLGVKEVKIGLNDYLNEEEGSWVEFTHATKVDDLDVIFSKPDLDEAEKLISSEKLNMLLKEAKESYDYIIVDTPPARHITDSAVLNASMDGCLLVVKQDLATVNEINETIERLKGSKDNLIGCIYNASVFNITTIKKAYGYGGRYGYGYGKRGTK